MVPHGSLWLYTYAHCHQTIMQQQPNGFHGSLGVTLKSYFFSANPCDPENGCVLSGAHWQGAIVESWRQHSGPPPLVRGSICKKKVEWDPGLN